MSEKAFIAYLRTRCGCQKNMLIPFPPIRTLIVPLKAKPFQETPITDAPLMETRTFDLIDWGGNPIEGYAMYEERPLRTIAMTERDTQVEAQGYCPYCFIQHRPEECYHAPRPKAEAK